MSYYPSKEQLQEAVRQRFGADVELAVHMPKIIGSMPMTQFKIIGSLLVYEDDAGKKWAIQVPFNLDYGLPVKEVA